MAKENKKKRKLTLGIIGGMGPEATAYFYWLLIKKTRAKKDQEHLHVIIDSYPQIPPRTEAILGKGSSPLPYLLESARRLQLAGAEILVIPCITAHYYYDELTGTINLPIINLLEVTVDEIRRRLPEAKKIAVMGSTGTMRSGLFHRFLEKAGLIPLSPNSAEQKKVMEAIFGPKGIKAGVTEGKPRNALLDVAHRLIDRGAEALIAGCTEIPLVLKERDLPVPLFDPMEIGARVCIKMAGYEIRKEGS